MQSTKVYRYTQPFSLQAGGQLPGFELAYQCWGQLNEEKNNVIWVCHALTGNTDVDGWWPETVGAGKMLDTDRYFVICANVLGGCYGSTGPLSVNPTTFKPYFHSFPLLSIADAVAAFDLLRKYLGIQSLAMLVGGSLGGQQAIQWAVSQPGLVKRLVLLATNARHSPWGIAFNEAQRMAIENDSSWKTKSEKAGLDGLKTARAIAMLSYRTYQVYNEKQEEQHPRPLDMFKASSYQQYQGLKLAQRFNAFTYWTLSKMMDSHDVGRAFGSGEEALNRVQAKTLVIGVDSDILFPVEEQKYIAQHIPGATFRMIHSDFGHDGFLVETEAVVKAVKEVLDFPETGKQLEPAFKEGK